jgi:putative peptide-modifying radical SAM enzyme
MITGLSVYFHLIITDECNLCCSYCRAKAFLDLPKSEGERDMVIDEDLPVDVTYDTEELYQFLKQDPSPTITFYGGEPLLRADLIERIVREAPVNRFMIQTNGTLLDRLPPETLNRFATILVSLDGREQLTDAHRGEGVYCKVMENVRKVRSRGYEGELIARMTVTEKTDIVDAVSYLADNPDWSFTSIHWQIDANFAGDFSQRRFSAWAEGSYNPGIRMLVQDWVRRIEKTGIIPKWYPFLDPMEDLLRGQASRLRCGSGYANYSILTDGHIVPCPVMIGMRQYYLGHIGTASPLCLPVIPVGGECIGCRIVDFCGGRCLYSNITRPWDLDERRLVCGTVENLQGALVEVLPRVRELIALGAISLKDFSHEKFNGCEIIP